MTKEEIKQEIEQMQKQLETLQYKYYVYYDNLMHRYCQCGTAHRTSRNETIYFSSEEIAKICADLLNKLGGQK